MTTSGSGGSWFAQAAEGMPRAHKRQKELAYQLRRLEDEFDNREQDLMVAIGDLTGSAPNDPQERAKWLRQRIDLLEQLISAANQLARGESVASASDVELALRNNANAGDYERRWAVDAVRLLNQPNGVGARYQPGDRPFLSKLDENGHDIMAGSPPAAPPPAPPSGGQQGQPAQPAQSAQAGPPTAPQPPVSSSPPSQGGSQQPAPTKKTSGLKRAVQALRHPDDTSGGGTR